MAGIFLSGFGITPVSASLDATDIPEFPAFGDCLEYLPLDHQMTPHYKECSTPEGYRFSITKYEFESEVGVGSGEDLPHPLQPTATVVDVPPIKIVFYINKEFQRSTPVIYKVEKGSDTLSKVEPILILEDYLRPWALQSYGYFCDSSITVAREGSFCHAEPRRPVPSDFPYYAFLTFSGGSHCCFNLIVVDKESPHHVLYEYYGGTSAPRFKDVDENGEYEMVAADRTYVYPSYGAAYQPSGPDIIWNMTSSGLSIATELMMRPLPMVSTLENYKSRISEEFRDSLLLYSVTLDLIYSGHEKEAWAFFDDAWPGFFDYWSDRDRWSSDKNTTNRTPKEETGLLKEEVKTGFVEQICNSLFARSLSTQAKHRFLRQTCNY